MGQSPDVYSSKLKWQQDNGDAMAVAEEEATVLDSTALCHQTCSFWLPGSMNGCRDIRVYKSVVADFANPATKNALRQTKRPSGSEEKKHCIN